MSDFYSNQKEENLVAGYDEVLARVTETTNTVNNMKSSITIFFEREKLRRAISELDECAERLGELDENLSTITRLQGDIDTKLHSMGVFSGLLDKGNAACVSLYQAYRAIQELEDRQNLYIILAAIAVTITASLFFVL